SSILGPLVLGSGLRKRDRKLASERETPSSFNGASLRRRVSSSPYPLTSSSHLLHYRASLHGPLLNPRLGATRFGLQILEPRATVQLAEFEMPIAGERDLDQRARSSDGTAQVHVAGRDVYLRVAVDLGTGVAGICGKGKGHLAARCLDLQPGTAIHASQKLN